MVKRLNSLIRRLYVPMTDEQADYVSMCANRVLSYKRAFLLVIIAIQLFNIFYTLSYTKFRLNTVLSRVYTALYVLLAVISVGAYWITGRMKKKAALTRSGSCTFS